MSDLHGHTLVIDSGGATDVAHPESDADECGFEAYVERDWGPESNSRWRPSRWEFILRTDDETGATDWLGTRTDETGVMP